MERIVVTGMGVVSALGVGKLQTFEALQQKRSGIAPIKYLQTRHKNMLVGEVKMSNDELRNFLQLSENQKVTRNFLLGLVAAKEAAEQANITAVANKKIAFVNGTTVGGIDKVEQKLEALNAGCELEYIDMYACGNGGEAIADHLGCCDWTMTVSTACSSAVNAIIQGANLIKARRCDVAIVGGMECLSKFHVNGFNTLMIIDAAPCRPFNRDRAGINLGEGAAYLVLETEQQAKRRGTDILCALSGYANSCDAFHQTASSPNGEGAYLAMNQALTSANLQPADIDYINAHGTGTGSNDSSESVALTRLFGENVPPFSSTKGYTGHTTSASGGVESVISILALQHNFIPANLNFKTPIDGVSCAPTSQHITSKKLRHVMNNAFGFGGNDSSCIFSKIE